MNRVEASAAEGWRAPSIVGPLGPVWWDASGDLIRSCLPIALVVFACGDRSATPTVRPVDPLVTTAPIVDASTPPIDAASVDPLVRSGSYRVRLGNPSRVAVINRDTTCNEHDASCQPGDCFQPAPYVDKPAPKPAMVACERDTDCMLMWTGCCKPDSVDVRAARVDQRDAVTKHVCKGTPCGGPPEGLVESFTIACVEKMCRMVQAISEAWCEQRDTRYAVMRVDGTRRVGERTFDCLPPAAACNLDFSCYREVARAKPWPSAEMLRCTRDTDCGITHVECCNCGAASWRPIRADAGQQWRQQNCGKDPVICAACVTGPPRDLAPACLHGSCELLTGATDETSCRQ